MLKLFTDISVLTEQNRRLVFPLLFDLYYTNNTFLSNYYKIVTDVNDCDIAVIPLEYTYALKHYKSIVKNITGKSKQVNKSIWVYSGGDFGYTIQDENSYNFRLGGFNSKLNKRTIIMPSFIIDPYEGVIQKNNIPVAKKTYPEIGFVGHAKGGFSKFNKELLSFLKINLKRFFLREIKDYQAFYPSGVKRAKYLNMLNKEKRLTTNFILRSAYRAGVKTKEERDQTTAAFYQNIYDNAYTFCMRGAGNFSVRFYETLAVGRVPILIDTDCKLPLSHKIEWNKHCLIIKENNKEDIVEQILKFHEIFNEDAFLKLQESNRNIWKDYLRRDVFFKTIHDDFIAKLDVYE